MPSYDAYLDNLMRDGMPEQVESSRTLKFLLNQKREPFVPKAQADATQEVKGTDQ